MNIIPTPQYTSYTVLSNRNVYRDALNATYCDNSLKNNIEITSSFVGEFEYAELSDAKLVITTDVSVAESIAKVDYAWFDNKNAAEQGYIIKGFKDGRILLFAKSVTGILYALSTLSQLENISPEFEIKDYPDFRFRANKWLIWAEAGVWSFDLGDGLEAMYERVVRRLDMCLQFKVNLLDFDAWGFDTQRFDGYAEFMSAVNREARKRSIRLCSNGYTMSYGLSAHQFGKHMSKVYKNRVSYPDGDVYDCLGTYIHIADRNDGKPYTVAREFGTCISNDALMELKLEEIREYIRKVQPGALYLHNMDSFLVSSGFWDARCENCRKRWPNDDLFAPDGMAGAFAEFFDKLNGGLKDIKVGDYNSSDMVIFNVSPGYMWYFIADEEVEKATKFWEAVLKYSKVRENVYPLVRELYYNLDDGKKRIPDIIAPALGSGFGVVNFFGSDGFHNDKLFFVSSIFNSFFKGADAVISCSGHYFQEPLQVFNAEYMWNCENSAFYMPDSIPDNYEDFMELHSQAQKTAFRPEEIYKKGGMLDIICQKLYGDDGEAAAEMFRLCGKNYECPVPYACNKEMQTAGHDVLLPYRWENILTKDETDEYVSSFKEMTALTKEACNILKDCKNEELKVYHKMLTLNLPIVSMWHSYLEIYQSLSAAFENGTPKEDFVDRIQSLLDMAEEKHREHIAMNFDTSDVMKGALAKREEMFVLMKTNLRLMMESVKTGKRLTIDKLQTKKEIW